MQKWHFYQGMNNEWRWYRMDESGEIALGSEAGFSTLDACMDNATERGFDRAAYQVHVRGAGVAQRIREMRVA